MKGHTPGPWEAKRFDGAGIEIQAEVPKGTMVSLMGGDEGIPEARRAAIMQLTAARHVSLAYEPWMQFPAAEWEAMQWANARLIAAAPDLLKACEGLLALYGDFAPGQPYVDPDDHPLAIARAAVAKAKGESR